MIRAGNTVVIVPSKLVKANSQIFLTPKTPLKQSLAVTGIIEGESFRVELADKESQDINFNWWVVGVIEESPNDQNSGASSEPTTEEILPNPPLEKEGAESTEPAANDQVQTEQPSTEQATETATTTAAAIQ